MAVKVISNIDDKRPEKLQNAINAALSAIGVHMSGAASRQAPRDTGRLAGSITWATVLKWSLPRGAAKPNDGVDMPNRLNVVHIGTNVEYAHMMEYGGLIQAKGKYLAIPISKMAKGHKPRDFQGTFVFRSKSGKKFIAYTPFMRSKKKGNTGKNIELLYRLKESVYIPSQSYLRKAFDEERGVAGEIAIEYLNKKVVHG